MIGKPMIGKIAWITTLVALAGVTSFAQIDRAARFAPPLADLVPQPFQGFSAMVLADQALADQRTADALVRARALIRVRPLPAEHLSLLARAALVSGDAELSVAALEEAGRRGWREPLSQRAMAQAALISGNVEAASQRIVALHASGRLDAESRNALVIELAATPQGRDALAQKLVDRGHWQTNFWRSAGTYLDPEIYADLTARADAIAAARDCTASPGDDATLLDRLFPQICPERFQS